MVADFSISVGPDGIVRIIEKGFWDVEIAARFVAEAEQQIAIARRAGVLRVIIDASRFEVPPPEVSEMLRAFDQRVRHPGDRFAVLVASSLLKMQLKRKIDTPGLEVLISPGAAETWVKA